jgi:alpha-L-fucosidase
VLDIPGRPDGTLDSKEIAVLDGITDWMQVNGEAIYETRPWKVYGEGPNIVKSGSFQGSSVNKLGATDIRFTRNKTSTLLYAIVLGWPSAQFVVRSLGTQSAVGIHRVERVQLLGTDQKVNWTQTAAGLLVELPPQFRPTIDYAAALKISLV